VLDELEVKEYIESVLLSVIVLVAAESIMV